MRHVGHLPIIINIMSSGMGGQVVWSIAIDVSIDLVTQSSRYIFSIFQGVKITRQRLEINRAVRQCVAHKNGLKI